jgi:hypothetical protein
VTSKLSPLAVLAPPERTGALIQLSHLGDLKNPVVLHYQAMTKCVQAYLDSLAKLPKLLSHAIIGEEHALPSAAPSLEEGADRATPVSELLPSRARMADLDPLRTGPVHPAPLPGSAMRSSLGAGICRVGHGDGAPP